MPHIGHVRLQICDGRQLLVHLQTCEVQYIEPADEPWSLTFDTEGTGFIHSGPTSHWVADILKECACSAEDGSLFVIAGDDQALVRLSDYRSRSLADLTWEMELPPIGKLQLNVRMHLRRPFGFYILWDALQLYKSLGLQSQGGAACKWASHGWARWRAFLVDDVALADHHLVNRTLSSRHTLVGQPIVSNDNPLADQRCFSTHAVLALSARWCSPDPRGSFRAESDRQSARGLLFAMVRIFATSSAKAPVWTLFLDTEAVWAPPAMPGGACPIDIVMHGATLDLQPLREIDIPLAHALVALLKGLIPAPIDRLPIVDILSGIAQHRKQADFRWFFRQLIWWLGRLLDQRAAIDLRDAEETPMACQSVRQRQKSLYKYWLAMRRAFREPMTLHLLVDGSTVLRKPMVCGLIAGPDSIGMIYPPQVRNASRVRAWKHGRSAQVGSYE